MQYQLVDDVRLAAQRPLPAAQRVEDPHDAVELPADLVPVAVVVVVGQNPIARGHEVAVAPRRTWAEVDVEAAPIWSFSVPSFEVVRMPPRGGVGFVSE